MIPNYHRERLDNGLTVVLERHTHVKTLAAGIWVRVGSAFESKAQNGISHFLEHMVFKGTEKRSAFQLSSEIEAVGGDLNAFTERELTCYHATVLNEHATLALDVLSDLVVHPTFPKVEMERERKVLLQELAMTQESPEERVQDLFLETVWAGEPLGLPIVGNKKTLHSMTRGQLEKFFSSHYHPKNMVLSVAGNIEFDQLIELANRFFVFQNIQQALPLQPQVSRFKPRKRNVVMDAEQLHLILGFDAPSLKSPLRFEALLLSFFLGGGMSSKLFQEIREKAGLAYTVDCDYGMYTDSGLLNIYIAMAERGLSKCLEILRREILELTKTAITKDVLNTVKGQLRGMLLMSSDQMDTRAESLARNEISFGRYFSVDEVIREIEKVSSEKIQELATELFVKEKQGAIVLSRKKIEIQKVGIV